MWLKIPPTYKDDDNYWILSASESQNSVVGSSLRRRPDGNLYVNVLTDKHRHKVTFSPCVPEEWCHLAYTWHPVKGLAAYINGTLAAEDPIGNNHKSEKSVDGGLAFGRAVGRPLYAECDLDEVLYWNEHKELSFIEKIYMIYVKDE